jgi:hypothetical protein
MANPLPKYARVSTTDPSAFAVCDRCGFWRNKEDLTFQAEWAGMSLYSKGILVCFDRCYDKPDEQLRTVILPPDPPPIVNARVPNFDYEEQTPIVLQFGTDSGIKNKPPPWGAGPQMGLCEQTGHVVLALQYLTSS